VKLGIVGLGRWVKGLTRAGIKSDKFKIVAGCSRSEEKRQDFQNEFGIPSQPGMKTLLSDPEMKGVFLTVPNEHHLPVAEDVAKAGEHVYTETPIANTLENGLAMEALKKQYVVNLMVGHSARLLKGTRRMKQAVDSSEIGTL
jgi:predicted dehydrogenase